MDDWRIILLLIPFSIGGVVVSMSLLNFKAWAWRSIIWLPFGLKVPLPGFGYQRHLSACGDNPEGQLLRPPTDVGDGQMAYDCRRPGRFRVVWEPPRTPAGKDVKSMFARADLREESGQTYLYLRVGVDLFWPVGGPLVFALALSLFEGASFGSTWQLCLFGGSAIFIFLALWAWKRQRQMTELFVAQLQSAYRRGYGDGGESGSDRDWYAWLSRVGE